MEFEVRRNGVVGFCAGEDGASGSAAPPGGSDETVCAVIGESSFPRLGGQVLSGAAVTGGGAGFSGSGDMASPACDEGIEVSLTGSGNTAAAMTARSPYKADFGTAAGLGNSEGREGAEEGGGGATD